MKDATEFINEEIRLKKEFMEKLLFSDDLCQIENSINDKIELCIIKKDFDNLDFNKLKDIVETHKNIDFWICVNNPSRKNILRANEAKIKNIIPCPVEEDVLINYFNEKNIDIIKKEQAEGDPSRYNSLKGLKVMVVDDNQMNIDLLTEVLSGMGLELKGFVKPKDAYEAVLLEKFDLFLLDVMMPEISGFDLVEHIQKTPHHQGTPIIFISALSDAQSKIKGYDLGSYAYIEKPFDINIIRSQIYNLLKNEKFQEIIDSTKEIFLATVAHDLKTPISAKISALKLLLNNSFGNLDENQQDIVNDILSSTKYMQDMVENILCKNKIEQGRIKLKKQVHSIKDVVEQCIEMTKYILDEKEQSVEFLCRPEDTSLSVDFLELKRAIQNLIANASAYSPKGSKIVIEISDNKYNLVVSVQDFGPGINIEKQKDIFEQYISYAKEHKTLGSGLGLFITKNIIDAHGGELILDSEVDKGTKISIVLPIHTKV